MKVDRLTMIMGIQMAQWFKLQGGFFASDAKGCAKQIKKGIEIAQTLQALWSEEDPDKPYPFTTGKKTVTTAGTAEQLHPDLKVPLGGRVIMIALPDNSDDIFFSETQGKCQTDGDRFDRLEPGDSIPFTTVTNLNQIWIDAASSGEGVSYMVELV